MYLQKLEIQGFKSFAQKTTLLFNRQLTAVVGPNGSGKSNIADAIRWVLGEQSSKLLRGKRAEDVIFAGSDQKGRLGMAEVSLFLNNEDGGAQVEYTEIVVTRRIFRDGQSEYLINNQAVRLQDVNLLLARSNFGQKTYSVIGQGMVDSILLSSPAERKEFFEEATGVKQYQLKREQAISKLVSTYENLEQAQVVINEIEPRLKTLTRQVKRLEERERLEQELRQLQIQYFRFRYHNLENKRKTRSVHLIELRSTLGIEQLKLKELQGRLSVLEKTDSNSAERARLIEQQNRCRATLNNLYKEQAVAQAEEEIEHHKRGEGEVVLLKQRLAELIDEATRITTRQNEVNNLQTVEYKRLQTVIATQTKISADFTELQSQSSEGWLNQELTAVAEEYRELRRELLVIKTVVEIRALVTRLDELEERLRNVIKRNGKTGSKSNVQLEQIFTERERVAAEIATLQSNHKRYEQEGRELTIRLQDIKVAQERIQSLLKEKPGGDHSAKDVQDITKKILELESKVVEIVKKLSELQSHADARNTEVFIIQRELATTGSVERKLEQEAHEVELELARLETKLDDLQVEMAGELPTELVSTITGQGVVEQIDESATAFEVQKLKRQWEATSGIEPEVISEYQQTKTRYDFLTTQVADLQTAAHQLEDIVHDLDETIHHQFIASFKMINEKFSEYFTILFSGGKAQLILQKEEPVAESINESVQETNGELVGNSTIIEPKPLTVREKFLAQEKIRATIFAGVEIQATPAGKKLSSMTALSGGEKALTSIALICAIISTHPSPFVVLDEVDAALDEANSERFAAIIDSISNQTQFITITHNRATMHKASLLYGVTMGNDGISKLLSVKLDEVVEKLKS